MTSETSAISPESDAPDMTLTDSPAVNSDDLANAVVDNIVPDDSPSEATPEDAAVLPTWDELLSTAELVSTTTRPKKVRVDVPPALVTLLEKARDTRQRVMFPITGGETQITELANVLASAGDIMKPERASVLVTTVDKDGKKTADVALTTHIRVSIGNRRGGSSSKRKGNTIPAISGPANGDGSTDKSDAESVPADVPTSAPPA